MEKKDSKRNIHGGDVYRNPVELDFSVNVNPFGMPDAAERALYSAVADCGNYPDMEAEQLKKAVSSMLHIPQEWLLFGNGASELFLAVMHGLRPKKTVIPVPSFYGYEYAAEAGGGEILFYEMKEEDGFVPGEGLFAVLTEEVDLLILANPNNPTGALMEEGYLQSLLEHCREKNIYVVLDECFIELCDDSRSVLPAICRKNSQAEPDKKENRQERNDFSHVLLIRAFTKLFAVPGVRLGYLICRNADLLEKIRRQLPEWNISCFAQTAGCVCATQKQYIEHAREYIRKERFFLEERLKQLGFWTVPGQANFILFYSADPLYEPLLEKGILIRSCENFRGLGKGFYRIAVKQREENERLLCAMEEIKKLPPAEIEKQSFAIISEELSKMGIVLPKEEEGITKRVIHTSADFDYVHTMTYSENAVSIAKKLLLDGADIVTDTNMALAGINKKVLERFGGRVHCFMADEDVAQEAKLRGITRAAVSMEKARNIKKPVIFAVGNAPTALIRLYEMMQEGSFRPAFIIGVPVGFVNVEAAKELIMQTDVPYMINRGRKGGSNIATAICNALLYELTR